VVHVLAREAMDNPHGVWMDDPPDFLVDIIAKEYSLLSEINKCR
jgi:hypothetical protein